MNLAETLTRADAVILPRALSESAAPPSLPAAAKLRVGVDLGTTYLVLVVLDEAGLPLAGERQFAQVVRDGLVVDFVGATDLLLGMKARLEKRLGRELKQAASASPPGMPTAEVRSITRVDGCSAFQGMAQVIQKYTGLPTCVPEHPMYVTPLGIAPVQTTPVRGAGRRKIWLKYFPCAATATWIGCSPSSRPS